MNEKTIPDFKEQSDLEIKVVSALSSCCLDDYSKKLSEEDLKKQNNITNNNNINNDINNNNNVPKKLVLNNDIDNIYCGKDFTIFHTKEKEIFACGNNDCGQLGIEKADLKSNNNNCIKPTHVEQFYKLEIIKVICGENNCIAMVQDSTNKNVTIWSWGNNREGQLGLGNNIEESKPKPIPSLLEYINHYPKDISCGNNHCLVLLQRNDYINIDQNKVVDDLILKYKKF